MLKITEYDDFDDFDYYDKGNKETYYYTVYYVTYYVSDSDFLSPIEEYQETEISTLPLDDETDTNLYKALSKIERHIDSDVAKGDYKGLWLHRIDIPVYSNYKQVDVDRWTGSSDIGEADVDSIEIELPKDWSEEDDDFSYLADHALSQRNNLSESIMNMAVRKHFKERSMCSEGLSVFQIGKRYPDFSMLEPFIIDYDVDLSYVEIGDILIRDWQYGHLPNTGYIPMEVIDITDDMSILVQTKDGSHYICNDGGISKDAMYHRLDPDFAIDDED